MVLTAYAQFFPPKISPMNSSPIRPLSVGNVVSASVRLFRSNFKPYMGIALKVMAWGLVPLIPSVINLAIWVLEVSANPASDGGTVRGLRSLMTMLSPIFFLLGIFCSAKAWTHGALISRLAFQELVGQPETVKEGWQQVRKRLWHFWLARFMVGLIGAVVTVVGFLVLTIVLLLSVGSTMVMFGINSADPPGAFSVMVGLITIGFFLLALVVPLWFQARLFVPELTVAVEQVSGSDAIVRSWQLSKGHAVRILMIILVASLMTVPPFVLAFVPGSFALVALIPQFQRGVSPETSVIFMLLGLFGVGGLLALLLGLLVIPFWQAIKAVIYYDLRSRREGMGLELRDR
jgi:hypothetical protein